MLITFGIGIVVGILIIVELIRLTMSEDPTGCMVLLGMMRDKNIQTKGQDLRNHVISSNP